MAEKDFKTLAHYGTDTYEEKKSVFIGEAMPVKTEAEALEFIASVKAKYPDARHHVYAYLLRENSKNRYSDDHEPQGTAGIPVLDVLRKSELSDAVLVVTRYFGGTLLGAGGLVRAYTAAAAGAVKSAEVLYFRTYRPMTVRFSYTDYNKISAELSRRGVRVLDTVYAQEVTLTLTMPEQEAAPLLDYITELTAGRAEISLGEAVFDHD